MAQSRTTKHLKDYAPPEYWIDTIDLYFVLEEEWAEVKSRLSCRGRRKESNSPLVLDGVGLELLSLKVDGRELDPREWERTEEILTIHGVPERFTLETKARIRPRENTALEGLYRSGGMFCTQCEAEGFRKITHFIDRPDIMAVYTVTVEADRTKYPVLLANGILADKGELPRNRHWARWEDPFPKPSYLFALVAGDLAVHEDFFVTMSGRTITLRIFVEHHNVGKSGCAMEALKKAMSWEESTFGLECDLDRYMIVAVDDFNMGAMENKGLNIFNSKYVLADFQTATDDDFAAIETVVAHEYFHNWTGNRVTCRDWFQLSLKEGLTVFRDQEFAAAMVAGAVKRIRDVENLRNRQFIEDAGAMAHPVRPESYMEINNFYTVTVYEKGAEVIRMVHALLGPALFRKGMDLYFARHDGQAVTCEDFVRAMEDAGDIDLAQFRLWFSQAGTPEISASWSYDPEDQACTVTFTQHVPPTPGQPDKKPMHIPIGMGLLDSKGNDMPFHLKGEKNVPAGFFKGIELREARESFSFAGCHERPVPSILRGFSAPVKLYCEYSDEDLLFLLGNDSDPFNRWEAGQKFALRVLLGLIEMKKQGRPAVVDGKYFGAIASVLQDEKGRDASFLAQILMPPTEEYLGEHMESIDVESIHWAHRFLRKAIGSRLKDQFLRTYRENSIAGSYAYNMIDAGRRRLKNLCLAYLMATEDEDAGVACLDQYGKADNMTDILSALRLLAHSGMPERIAALYRFQEKWKGNPLVMDKWLAIQATAPHKDTLATVKSLLHHPAFSLNNPNRIRALIGSFCGANQVRFHDANGEGYRFLAEQALAIDPRNNQIAARLLGNFSRWRRFDGKRQELMKKELERVLGAQSLSRDAYEVVSKCLGTAE